MIIRTPYNYDAKKASNDTRLSCQDEHLTVQDQAEDVNDIMRKFGHTGKMPLDMRVPLSGDFSGVGTYQECLQAVKTAQNEFMKLPATIRERFKHDPEQFINFVEDEKNAEEGEKLGIWKLRKPEPKVPEVVPPVVPAAKSQPPTT